MFAADSKFDVAQSSFCFFIHFKPILKFSICLVRLKLYLQVGESFSAL